MKGSDGKNYSFLCKPCPRSEDLRKDSRMMEFNTMINKLLKKDPDCRRRNLCNFYFMKHNIIYIKKLLKLML